MGGGGGGGERTNGLLKKIRFDGFRLSSEGT